MIKCKSTRARTSNNDIDKNGNRKCTTPLVIVCVLIILRLIVRGHRNIVANNRNSNIQIRKRLIVRVVVRLRALLIIIRRVRIISSVRRIYRWRIPIIFRWILGVTARAIVIVRFRVSVPLD